MNDSLNSKPPPDDDGQLSEDGRAHYSVEQETLGAEKNDLIRGVESDRTFALVASGAIWAWFATTPLQGVLRSFYLLPLGIALLFILKRFAANTAIDQVGKYVLEMEHRILPSGIGWEKWLVANRTEWFRKYDIVFWAAVCICDSLLAFLLWSRP